MKSKKERMQSDSARYIQIINDAKSTVHREDIYSVMATGIKRWIADNIDYAARAWFERVEQTVLRARQSTKQGELGFMLDADAIVALGDSQRVRLGHCNKELCEMRRKLVEDSRDSHVAAAAKELAALDDAIERLRGKQTLDDLLGEA